MRMIRTIKEFRQWRQTVDNIAFVPTMGNLHAGHLALIEEAKKQAAFVVVSIFVNRLQFGQGEDFEHYPRTLDEDVQKLQVAGVDALFLPDESELYPDVAQDYQVEPPNLQHELCGKFRPGHFRGVSTVVAKLFNIVEPQVACFGKKDYQQLSIISAMVKHLNFNVNIVPVDTGRASDGLALSSRNAYLSAEERKKAPQLFTLLQEIAAQIQAGSKDYAALENQAYQTLKANGWQPDYIEIRHAQTLAIPRLGDKNLVVLAAARLGKTRLIDNVEIH